MREALQEKEDAKGMKAKQREKVRPKLGKIDIDYQKLHDAFFKWQTKPRMTMHGDLYYEGKEFEIRFYNIRTTNNLCVASDATSVADLDCLSRILIFANPGSPIPDPITALNEEGEKLYGSYYVL